MEAYKNMKPNNGDLWIISAVDTQLVKSGTIITDIIFNSKPDFYKFQIDLDNSKYKYKFMGVNSYIIDGKFDINDLDRFSLNFISRNQAFWIIIKQGDSYLLLSNPESGTFLSVNDNEIELRNHIMSDHHTTVSPEVIGKYFS